MRPERLPEDHYNEAIEFLTGVFPRSQDAPIVSRELRHWKYYVPHPFAKQSRCYVFRDEEGLTAHAGFSPVQYATADGIRTSFQVIDWAGAPRRPGAGFLLFQALWKEADSHLGVGGSNDAVRLSTAPVEVTAGEPLELEISAEAGAELEMAFGAETLQPG